MAFTVKHKRSGDKDKAPAAGSLTPGELAINYNVDSPAAYIKDSAGNIVKLAGAGSASTPDASETVKGVAEIATKAEVTAGTDDARIVTPLKLKQAVDALPPGTTVAAAAPGTPEDGQAFFDTTTNTLKIWDGAAWKTSQPAASETVAGIAEIATKAEVTAGTDDAMIVSPLKLKQALDALPPGTTVAATAPLAPESGQAFFDTTTNTLKIWDGTAWKTSQPAASETVAGIAELATQAEVTAGTDDTRIVTPLKLKQAVDALPPGTTVSATAPTTPEDGQAWFDSTNTILKVWDGTAWQPAVATSAALWTRGGGGLIPATAADNVFVGGTSAAPKIKLTAADGSAEFAGSVKSSYLNVAAAPAQTSGNLVKIDGASTDVITFGYNGSATFAGDVKIGGTLPASPNISLKADGNATCTGVIRAGSGASSTDSKVPCSYMQDSGGIFTYRSSANGTASVFQAGVANGTSAPSNNVVIRADGSATFASDVKIGGTAAAPKIKLYANGMAEFADQIMPKRIEFIGTGIAGKFIASDDFQVLSSGTVYLGDIATTGPNITLNSDGSANFASNVKIGGTLPASPNITLNANGSASFAGGLAFANGKANAFSNANGVDLQLRSDTAGDQVLGIYTGGWSSAFLTASVKADGSAMFKGTVTATVVPPSDQKFKENITPASPQLADVVALGKQLKNFDWNDKVPLNDELRAVRQLGLIAQEAEKVSPGIVKTIKRTKRGKELTPEKVIPAVYKEVVDPQDEENYSQELVTPEQTIPATYEEVDDSFKGISHDALIMKLLGAIAELSAEVDALKVARTPKTSR